MKEDKTYTYRYRGEAKSGFYWSVLFLTDSGIFSAVGDTGQWAYSSFYTDDIRRFVLSLDPKDDYYLPTKLAKGKKTEFLPKETLREAKHVIIEARKYRGLAPEKAREAWDYLPSEWDSEQEWLEYLSEYREVYGDEYWYVLHKDWDSMLKSFLKNSLPGLQELIKKELEEEACIKETLVV